MAVAGSSAKPLYQVFRGAHQTWKSALKEENLSQARRARLTRRSVVNGVDLPPQNRIPQPISRAARGQEPPKCAGRSLSTSRRSRLSLTRRPYRISF
jgi:hypothetical protein